MTRLWLVVLISACETPADFPVVPGGPGTGQGGGDASTVPPSDALSTLAGRVCVQSDLRSDASCAATGVDGVRVELGSSVAYAGPDGSFAIELVSEPAPLWRVSGEGAGTGVVMPALVRFGPELLLRTVAAEAYAELMLENGVVGSPDFGSIVLRVTQGGEPKLGAAAAVSPDAQLVFYDGGDPLIWDTDATGASGIVWVPQVDPGLATLRVTALGATPTDLNVVVEVGAISFETLALP